jgi:chemosensory pili system protein ChpA (sensor histidine kinase/response regulator)
VVEDDAEARSILRLFLELDGWRVETAADGVDAISQLEQELPNIVLLDLSMPRLDGWGVLARRAAEPSWLDVPVLAMSADHAQGAMVIELGASAFLGKPFSLADLRAALARLIEPLA